MSESEKLARILELYRSLSDDEKDLLAGELVRDEDMMRRLLEVKKSLTQARRIIHAILNGQPIPSPETPSTLPPGNIPTIAPSMPVQTAFPTLASTSTPGEVETQ